jgi:beta-lactamase superfamily II metal-dependent hydrolase
MKKLPKKGFVFWPVGNGDSTTIVIKENDATMQVDLRHCESADDDDSPMTAVLDELVRLLPKRNGKPYLSLFVLTHPDEDHCLGFKELLKKVTIGELWHTPRIFREYKKDLCEDAQAFREEARRRRDVTIEKQGEVESGDRVRVIGHDDIFEEDDYKDFPAYWRTTPGTSVTEVDGEELGDIFEAFIHAPFKDDMDDTRNNTSLAFQINLKEADAVGKALFFGDREYPLIKKIFDKTKERERTQYLEWDVMLAAHHCSKCVMYWADADEEEEKFRQDIMDDFEEVRREGVYIIASCRFDFGDADGKLPPHQKARNRYEEIVETGHFTCTHEHPNKEHPEAIVFVVDANGIRYEKPEGKVQAAKTVANAVNMARGDDNPPKEQVGFGRA